MADVAAVSLSHAASPALVASRALPASVLLVAAVLPFERPLPASVLGLTLTTVELAIGMALGLGVIAWWRESARMRWRTPLIVPLLALACAATVSAIAAPELNGEALRIAARFVVAIALFVLVANVASSDRAARRIVAALLAAGAAAGAIGILELAQVPWVLDALTWFRPGFHVVGGQLRATSTFVYPTIASMFLEVAFALGLVWIGSSRLAFGALVLTGAGVIATFTRAGLITMAMSLAIYGGLRYALERRWHREHTRLIALAGVLIALVLASRSPQLLAARMTAEGSQEWYGAAYDAPKHVTLAPDSFNDIPITLTNQGRLTWQSSTAPPFALSYHWLAAASDEVVIFDGLRTPFPHPVAPGESVTLTARVRAPNYPGSYVLVWDVVQEHRTWLSLEGVYPARSTASIEGAASGAPPKTHGRLPSSVMRMPRSVLWAAALEIAREHPWLGIGPDNFRHVYGRVLGLATWDARVHANNSYLEVLVGMGAAGVLLLAWLIGAAFRSSVRVLSTAPASSWPVSAAAATACLAIAAHAVVDSFLTFTPTYAVFAIAAGLLYAHRV